MDAIHMKQKIPNTGMLYTELVKGIVHADD